MADDFDFDFTDDDAPARPTRRTTMHRSPRRRDVSLAARVVFVLPSPDGPGQLYVEGHDGHRHDLDGPEQAHHLAAVAHTYISVRSIFSDQHRAALDRIADENGY